ncbi:MAG: lytic transglycosylase domain-containing protein [Enterobacterales bacterium endosymbiont of Blomia tropicalis]|uniref:lytic transglycosylase domain-containing protein n=1 Tax=Mixta mediterraneensis TaxID=2758443 RepID=UPI0025A787C3|nr:lytic transglycosylase domain-containing protein [Mixta mediterraneensis]MDL4915783.1 lytic transglycosylase domain-containing protein [Mixta mediterraneensis]
MRTLLLTLCFLLPVSPSLATCWYQAGARYGIEPELLQAIAIVESGLDPNAINKNNDGTVDYGLMQINSRHLGVLKKYQISQQDLIQDPCQSVMAGAWILAGNIQRMGYTWEAVGAYNAGAAKTPQRQALRQKYIQKVVPHYLRLKSRQKNKHS